MTGRNALAGSAGGARSRFSTLSPRVYSASDVSTRSGSCAGQDPRWEGRWSCGPPRLHSPHCWGGEADRRHLALEARLLAERDVAERLKFPDELLKRRSVPETATAIADQGRRYKERRATIDNDTKILRTRLEQTMKELGGLQKQETALQDQLENIASDVESFSDSPSTRGFIRRANSTR